MIDLKQSVQYIKGVGPSRAKLLSLLGVNTVEDLINYYPRTYEDRTKIKKIEELQDGEDALIEAVTVTAATVFKLRRNMSVSKVMVQDDTGRCLITWFNQDYMRNVIHAHEKYRFFGKVTKKLGQIEMASPVFDEEGKSKNTGKIVPVYSTTKGLSDSAIRQAVENALSMVNAKLQETLPEYITKDYHLMELDQAVREIHFPSKMENLARARNRLVFEELLTFQLALLSLKEQYDNEIRGIKYSKDVHMSDVINTLPFKLTKAQLRVLEEIDNDMESEKPMNRLLQGDVGSGKTVVAMIAAYKAVKSGYQVAVMAPTTILATQHINNFNKILEPFGIRCGLLVSSLTKKQKGILLEKLKNGEIDILIGTHALLQENIEFKNVGLVVTDEQHRFGVKQRSVIAGKGKNPDVLVMTATPIPRTLAISAYGDTDISIIKTMPKNRKAVITKYVDKEHKREVMDHIKNELKNGHQIYVVTPLIEESEVLDTANATKIYENMKQYFAGIATVGLIHGKLKPDEKEKIMQEFLNNEIQILVATSVIEVGVNVVNATTILVLGAERFGVATLHQLRGRVMRSDSVPYCFFITSDNPTENSIERLKMVEKTTDGFALAEYDLKHRGPGEFFGEKQSGSMNFKYASLKDDSDLLEIANTDSEEMVNNNKLFTEEDYKYLYETAKHNYVMKQTELD